MRYPKLDPCNVETNDPADALYLGAWEAYGRHHMVSEGIANEKISGAIEVCYPSWMSDEVGWPPYTPRLTCVTRTDSFVLISLPSSLLLNTIACNHASNYLCSPLQ